MTPEKRALRACVEYARLQIEITHLGREIGRALGECQGIAGKRHPVEIIGGNAFTLFNESDPTHLSVAYECDRDESGRYFMEPDEQLDFLSACPHCLTAHHAVQARKKARKSLGAAKRTITMIGRAGLTTSETT